MALGVLGRTSGRTLQVRLAENVAAGGLPAPTLATEGFDLLTVTNKFKFDDRGAIMIHKASGSGVSIASARIHGYYGERVASAGPLDWGPMGPGTAADRGKLNLGGVIAEVSGKILYLDNVDGLLTVERVFVSLGAISVSAGSALVHVDLILNRRVR